MQKRIHVLLQIIGIGLIVVGLVAAYYGPLEIYVFYFFSEGGQFFYNGFGMGSAWFAALVVQNIGYYIIAALFIPAGIGHVKRRRWALTLTQLYLWFWLGTGILFIGNFIMLIPKIFKLGTSQEILTMQVAPLVFFLLFTLIVLPVAGLWLYRSDIVKSEFEEQDKHIYWTEKYPFSLLAVLFLFVIMIIVFHLTIFFQCLLPMFGEIMLGRSSAYIIAGCILILGILIYGTVRLEKWAWWSSIVFVSLLSISSAMSFSRHSFYNIILMMKLPAYEMEFLNKLTVIHDARIVGLVVTPLLIVLGLLVYSKRFFGHSILHEKTNAS
jgi:hypothetical protein